MKKVSSKILAILLSFAVVLSMMPGMAFADVEGSITAKVRFTSQAEGAFLHAPQYDVEVSSNEAETYGYSDSVDGVSALDVLVKAHEITFGEAYTTDTADFLAVSSTGYVTKLFGEETSSNGFLLNSGYPNDGTESSNGTTVTTTKVVDGNSLDFYIYQDTASWSDSYSFVETDKSAGEAGNTVDVTVKGTSVMAGYLYKTPAEFKAAATAVSNAGLAWVNISTGEVTRIENVVTDSEGKATVTLPDTAGTYYLTAVSTDSSKIIMNPIQIEVKENYTKNIAKKYSSNGVIGTSNEPWLVADLMKYDSITGSTSMTAQQKQDYLDWVYSKVKANDTNPVSAGDLSKYILSIVSMGYSPANIIVKDKNNITAKTINLYDYLKKYINTESTISEYTLPYVILAMDTYQGSDKDAYINILLEQAIAAKDRWMNTSWGPDALSPMLLALSGHTDYEGISGIIDSSVDTLKTYFSNRDSNNAFTLGLALAAFSSVNENPEKVFYNNGNDLISALIANINNSNNGFLSDTPSVQTSNEMATEQGFRGLVANAGRAKNNSACRVYDFSYITTRYIATVHDTDLEVSTNPVPGTDDSISVWFTLYGDSEHDSSVVHTYKAGNLTTIWVQKTKINVPKNATAKDVIEKALIQYGITFSNTTGAYINPINGFDGGLTNGSKSGWMYLYNGLSTLNSINQQNVNEGDSIIVYFTDDYSRDLEANEDASSIVQSNAKYVNPHAPATNPEPSEPTISITDKDGKDASSMGKVEYDASSNCVDISPSSGYKVSDVKVNGVSKGAVTRLEGIKATDRIEVVFEAASAESETPAVSDQTAKIIAGVQAIKPKVTNTRLKSGIKVYWKKNSSYKVSYYQVYRKTGKNGTYKLIYTTKLPTTLKITNVKNLKKGKTYYYRVRGVRVIDGKKYYTKWSNYTYRKFR